MPQDPAGLETGSMPESSALDRLPADATTRQRSRKTDAARDSDGSLWQRLLEGQSAVIDLLSKGASLERTLERLARVVEVAIPTARCAILLHGSDGAKSRCISAPALPSAVSFALEQSPAAERNDPLAVCALRREPLNILDLSLDPRWSTYHELIAPLGFQACSVQPILGRSGEVLAVIALHYREPGEPDRQDYRILDALCPLARVVIESFRRVAALETANERFSSITAGIAGVVYQRVVNIETGEIRYAYMSDSAKEFFGVPAEEVLNNPEALFACYGEEYRRTFRQRLITASRNMTMWDVETPIIARDGTRKWSHAIAKPERRPDGTVLWSGVILDATRMKEANIALAASDRAKSEFLANMSHELRTPLNAIIGFSDIMRSQLHGAIEVPQYRDYVDDIHGSGVHLLRLINEILDLSKVEAGKLGLAEDVIDLGAAVESSIRMVSERAATQQIALSCEFPTVMPRLLADERKLKQILLNLLSNAIKFTPPGGSAHTRVSIEADGGLRVSVQDTGIGIAPEHLPKVFDPFFQVDSGLSRRFEGTGLGLALTRAMVELHGGTVGIESEFGKGSTVTARFPKERVVVDSRPLKPAA